MATVLLGRRMPVRGARRDDDDNPPRTPTTPTGPRRDRRVTPIGRVKVRPHRSTRTPWPRRKAALLIG